MPFTNTRLHGIIFLCSLTISMGLQQINGLLRKTDSRKRLVLLKKARIYVATMAK